jgi:hypothetical protein
MPCMLGTMDSRKPDPMRQDDTELAGRLCAAYVSVHLGISLRHAYETYSKATPPGPYWQQLARRVRADWRSWDPFNEPPGSQGRDN